MALPMGLKSVSPPQMRYEDVRVLSAGISGRVPAGLPTQAG